MKCFTFLSLVGATAADATFGCTGSVQTTVVPAGTNEVRAVLKGAAGGESFPGNTGHQYASMAGYGGQTDITFTVSPGDTLKIYAGCVGGNGNGCGAGGCGAGGGGGATSILQNGQLVAVAGGGGGSSGANDQGYTHENHGHGGEGGGSTGGQGGTDGCGCGQNGNTAAAAEDPSHCGGGGTGGSQSAVGSGGGGNRGEPNGASGSNKNGGACGGTTFSTGGWGWGQGGAGCIRSGDGGGGGGGGGYYGGGGGGSGCHGVGGGGGSSFCASSVQTCSKTQTGFGYNSAIHPGSVELVWISAPVAPVATVSIEQYNALLAQVQELQAWRASVCVSFSNETNGECTMRPLGLAGLSPVN